MYYRAMRDKTDDSVKLFSYNEDQPNIGRGVLIPRRSTPAKVTSFTPKSITEANGRGSARASLSIFALVALVVLGTSGYGYVSSSSQSASSVNTTLDESANGSFPLNFGPADGLSEVGLFLETRDAFIEEGLSFIEIDVEAKQLRYFEKGVLLLSEEILKTGEVGSIYELSSGLYQVESKAERDFINLGQVYLPWLITFQGNYQIHGQPNYPNGDSAQESAAGGVRLSDESAEDLFAAAVTGLPILVREGVRETKDDFVYEPVVSNVSARSYLVADVSNNTILAANEIDKELPIASVVKLMTAVVAAEKLSLDSRVRIASETFVTSLIPRLSETSTVSMYSLMQLLLIESSNEAAETIAGEYGREEFMGEMNAKARQLGMLSTNFYDPSGLSPDNISTAEDLYKLIEYIQEDKKFILNITANRKSDNIYLGDEFKDMINFNEVVDMDNFIGGKVGETNAALQTSVSLHQVEIDGRNRTIAVIVLGSCDRSGDVEKLLEFVDLAYNN